MSMNFGSAVAARMPRMTMTTTSSISVKPLERLLRLPACLPACSLLTLLCCYGYGVGARKARENVACAIVTVANCHAIDAEWKSGALR
jgi:hypothetical protein